MKEQVEIREVMTDGVIAVEQDQTVKEAAEMLEEEHIRGLVVVDGGEAVGVVVCRDIVYEVVKEGKDPEEVKVEDIMSTDLIVSEADEYLDEVAMAMAKNDVSRVPIVEGEMLTGIVTQSDILRAWPGFAEIMEEEINMDMNAARPEEPQSGECEECENYSEELREVGGLLLCPECRS
jgi:CBS domain-containing protein